MKTFLNNVKTIRQELLVKWFDRVNNTKLAFWLNSQEESWWVLSICFALGITTIVLAYIPSYICAMYKAIVSK